MISKRTVKVQGDLLKMTVSSESISEAEVKATEEIAGGSVGTISIRANIIDELENNCQKYRTSVVKPDGFLISPLHVLKELSEDFVTPLHSEVFLINYKNFEKKLWRVDLMIGEMKGVGQAPLRPLAFQMAAADLLEKIKVSRKDLKLPLYGLWPGCRISPSMYKVLNYTCNTLSLPSPKFEVTSSKEKFEDELLFEVVCKIGLLVTSAKSDCRFMGKRLAGKAMLEQLTHDPFPDLYIALGSDCIGLNQLKSLGINTLMSSRKKKWMEENRMVDGKTVFPDDEPDDGDLVDVEDAFENLTMEDGDTVRIPKKGMPTGLIRVVKNEGAAETGDSLQDPSSMDI